MMKKMKFTQAFTMIELMTMMIVMMIIVGITVGVSSGAIRRARRVKAEAMIAALEAAVSMYHADTGLYPPNDSIVPGCGWMYLHLTDKRYADGNPNPDDIPGWRGPYMEFEGKDVVSFQVLDPWGKPYQYNYEFVPANAPCDFQIHSYGPDGLNQNGYGDDIRSWQY